MNIDIAMTVKVLLFFIGIGVLISVFLPFVPFVLDSTLNSSRNARIWSLRDGA
jgi:hypothetical protein